MSSTLLPSPPARSVVTMMSNSGNRPCEHGYTAVDDMQGSKGGFFRDAERGETLRRKMRRLREYMNK